MAGGVTDPGVRNPISRKWRPFNGISCTVWASITAFVASDSVLIDGAIPVTSMVSALAATRSVKFCSAVRPTSRMTLLATMVCIPDDEALTR